MENKYHRQLQTETTQLQAHSCIGIECLICRNNGVSTQHKNKLFKSVGKKFTHQISRRTKKSRNNKRNSTKLRVIALTESILKPITHSIYQIRYKGL